MKAYILVFLVFFGGCSFDRGFSRYNYTYSNPPNSGISDQQFYKDKSDCEFKDYMYLQQGVYNIVRDAEYFECMKAYKATYTNEK